MTKWKLVPVEPTYHCGKCHQSTPPPRPYTAYVECPCGHLTAATAAAPDPTDDAELVERGGRAICEADGHDWDKLGSDTYHRMERQAIYKRQFRAALKAIQDEGE